MRATTSRGPVAQPTRSPGARRAFDALAATIVPSGYSARGEHAGVPSSKSS